MEGAGIERSVSVIGVVWGSPRKQEEARVESRSDQAGLCLGSVTPVEVWESEEETGRGQ